MKNLRNVLIFGDSYSTFNGFIPEGFAPYYTEISSGATDVLSVSQTWWHQVVEETGSNLVLNNSWSGSTIGNTGYNNEDCSATSSFIFRLNQLKENGFFEKNKIDTVFVFGGTNDSWCGAPLGEIKYSDWSADDLFKVLPAICCFLSSIKETLPDAEIVCIINSDLKPEITNALKTAGEHYGILPIILEGIDKVEDHPTAKGMAAIKTQVLNALNN